MWNNLGFSLYATLSVCYVVTTSGKGKKSEIGVNANWCVAIEHWRLSSIRIHPVVNISQIVWYKEQVEGQKKEEGKPVEVEGVKEWEVEKILNKKKIRGVEKYLVW